VRISLAIIGVIFILFCASNAQAEIYTCKDDKGDTVYTDSPDACVNVEEVKVDALPALVPSKSIAIPNNNRSVVNEDDKNAYTELVITSPINDATVRDNQGNLTINFRAAPALQTRKGHKYVVTFDGAEVYSGTSTITALKNVDRGTHSISVKIVDASGSTKISATPVKVTLQRYSSLQNSVNTPNDGNNGNTGTGNGSFNFPGNTKLPTSPPPLAN